jgi:uncharacterized protein (TIGR02266 family)
MKKDNTQNQRIPRKLICIPIFFSEEGKNLFKVDYSTDLSEGGVLIQTPEPLPVGTRVDIKFRLPGGIKLIETKGEVVWSHKKISDETSLDLVPGMGVKFLNLDEKSKKYIETFIKNERETKVFEEDLEEELED